MSVPSLGCKKGWGGISAEAVSQINVVLIDLSALSLEKKCI